MGEGASETAGVLCAPLVLRCGRGQALGRRCVLKMMQAPSKSSKLAEKMEE